MRVAQIELPGITGILLLKVPGKALDFAFAFWEGEAGEIGCLAIPVAFGLPNKSLQVNQGSGSLPSVNSRLDVSPTGGNAVESCPDS